MWAVWMGCKVWWCGEMQMLICSDEMQFQLMDGM
jgi:hypothetical protein